jgi:hypothetical protein
MAMKKGANALYIGVLHPVTLKTKFLMTDLGLSGRGKARQP